MPCNRSVINRRTEVYAIAISLVEAIDTGIDLVDILAPVRLGASSEALAIPVQGANSAIEGYRSVRESTGAWPLRNGSVVYDGESESAILLDIDLLTTGDDLDKSWEC